MNVFIKQVACEMLSQKRQLRGLVNFCLFFLMMLFIFPLTLKPEIQLLRTMAPGLIWMALLLALLLSAERLFQNDYENGITEQWLVSGESVALLVGAKIFAHWLMIILPLFLLSPIIALIFSFSLHEMAVLMVSLLCSTPALLLLCALASAFGLGLNQKAALMALILLPLTLPILVFGSGTLTVAMQGLPVSGYLALLLAISLIAIGFLPVAIAAVIRISHME